MQDATPPNTTTETLPEVALSALPEATKDYLIALHAQTGKPIAELIRDILNDNATPLVGGAA